MGVYALSIALLLAGPAPLASAPVGPMVDAVEDVDQDLPPPSERVMPPPVVPTIGPEAAVPVPAADAAQEGDIVITGRNNRGDPLAAVNAKTFDATQSVDRAFVGPLALAYKKKIPSPFRDGITNFLGNLREPVVAVNYFFQLKPGKAFETLGRFVLNTTVGVAGLFDVAKRKPFRLPRRRNSFANTLGLYGVKPGPFFFLPLIGPTTLRDLLGAGVDQVVVPIGPVQPLRGNAYTLPLGFLSALSYRAAFDDDLERIRNSPDPYAAARRYYLDRRQREIDGLRGRKRVSPPPVVPTILP